MHINKDNDLGQLPGYPPVKMASSCGLVCALERVSSHMHNALQCTMQYNKLSWTLSHTNVLYVKLNDTIQNVQWAIFAFTNV